MSKELDNIEKEIIVIAAQRYGINKDEIMKHGTGYQNLVYEYQKENKDYILRISKASTRTYSEIHSELDFLNHLSKDGVSVSLPVKSLNNNLVETIEIKNEKHYAVSFVKAIGKHINYPDYLDNHEMFYELGKITGKLHKSSMAFSKNKRIEWTNNYYLKNFENFILDDEPVKRASLKKQMAVISNLTKNHKNFGLIHGDINVGNFFVDDNRITLFDFDECQNSWYVEDIAIQLFYTVYVLCDDSIEERHKKAVEFMQHFLRGYTSECEIDVEMLKLIPEFLILREMIVHVGIYKMWNLSDLEGWAQDYYRDSSRRIETLTPIVSFDDAWCNFN